MGYQCMLHFKPLKCASYQGYEGNAAQTLPLARRLASAGALTFVVAGATAAVLLLLALALRHARRVPAPPGH